ncbi:MAG: pseudouridylate synthase [Bacteroidetes bacterium]|nr:pseudouridylate synthase [Bacteroidota bacterium]MBU1371901.1 pseudouridylate synthase [Bacteroidota bacterium]MBU1483503.1 pseudouridylate synthase [Bacteroidota bacterium]MBU1761031.1 pseudouridylate synthase [Bacteroidota bacterium]MBU2267833.1 pseudouridylate synthase [Bacteroidota bacterium]
MLEILYQDDYIVAINKPHGLLVHQSSIARDAEEFALQLLRDQIGKNVWPAHRLDRKTGGVLLFGLDQETNKLLQALFRENQMQKKYLAIVRGYFPNEIEIDYPLKKENGAIQEAYTKVKLLQHFEVPFEIGKYPTSRYSLVEAHPQTGRMHQIRKHLAHVMHPIIGDRPHGCNKQNRYFKNEFVMDTMMLHACELGFSHPYSKDKIHLKATLLPAFEGMLSMMNHLNLTT